MKIDTLIDISATIGKTAIDQTKFTSKTKNIINFSIDLVAEILKNELSLNGVNIKQLAQYYDIEKVMLIPLCSQNGQVQFAISAYGVNSRAFIARLGISIVSDDAEKSIICDNFKKGYLIYEKPNSNIVI